MSVLCTDHLNACIQEFCVVKMRKCVLDKTSEVKIPVENIIDQVKGEFGYYLPYLLLKRFERLNDSWMRIIESKIL